MSKVQPTPRPAGLHKYLLLGIGIFIYLATVGFLLWRPLNPWPSPPGIGDVFACFLGAALNPLLAFVFIVHLMLRPDPIDSEQDKASPKIDPKSAPGNSPVSQTTQVSGNK